MATPQQQPAGSAWVCAVCKREIANVRIECAVCSGVSLCLDCFVSAQEAPELGHVSSHSYKVHENLASFSMFEKGWTAEEELMLLQGIDMYGLGNWRDIATFVATKTESQVYKHYLSVYLESPTAPQPSGDPSLCMPLKREAGAASGSSGGGGGGLAGSSSSSSSSSSSAADGGASSSDAAAAAPSFSSSAANLKTGSASAASAAAAASSSASAVGRSGTGGGGGGVGTSGYSHAHIPKTEVSGYLPLRGDFDVEHDNDAEGIIADMDFVEGEHSTETELKLKILEIYNAKLDERERRKAFVLERGLLDYKRLLMAERRRPREERDVYDAFRPFARFLSPAEHEDLVRGIILENRLRKRIAQLQEYRRAGIRTLAEAQEYEAAKRKREQSAAMRRGAGASSAYLYEGLGGSSSGGGGQFSSSSQAAGGAGDSSLSRSARASSRSGVWGSGAAASASPAGEDGGAAAEGAGAGDGGAEAALGDGGARKKRRGSSGVAGASAAASAASSSSPAGLPAPAAPKAGAVGRGRAAVSFSSSGGGGAAPSSSSSSSAVASAGSAGAEGAAAGKAPRAFSLEGVPGAERLSSEERGLCEYLQLLPWQYTQIKAAIVNLSLAKHLVRREDASSALVHVDVAKINGVYDFAVSSGWVRAPAGEPVASTAAAAAAPPS